MDDEQIFKEVTHTLPQEAGVLNKHTEDWMMCEVRIDSCLPWNVEVCVLSETVRKQKLHLFLSNHCSIRFITVVLSLDRCNPTVLDASHKAEDGTGVVLKSRIFSKLWQIYITCKGLRVL